MKTAQPELPAFPQAEQILVGALLHHNDTAWEVRSLVAPTDFTDPACASVFQAILTCLDRNEPADLVTLTEVLRASPSTSGIGPQQLADYMLASIGGQEARRHAELVKDASERRALVLAAQDAIRTACALGQPLGEARTNAEAKLIQSLSQQRSVGIQTAADLSARIAAEYDSPPATPPNILTGFGALDSKLGGLEPGGLYVIAGRPSMGKTMMGSAIASNVITGSARPVLFFTLEVSSRRVVENMTCALARVRGEDVRKRRLDSASLARWKNAVVTLCRVPLRLQDKTGVTVNEIRATMRVECARYNVGLVVVDYLHLVAPERPSDPRERQIAEISAGLKLAARESNVPVIALAQLNRAVETRKDKRPKMGDLRESGAIEQDADVVMLLYRAGYYERPEPPPDQGQALTVCIAKNRNGPTGMVSLLASLAFTRIDNPAPSADAEDDWARDE